MFKSFALLILFLFLVSCGESDNGEYTIADHNLDCLAGKISGQFIVKYSDDSFELVHATDEIDLESKLNSPEHLEKQRRQGVEVSSVDYNFKNKAIEAKEPSSASGGVDPALGPKMLSAPFMWSLGHFGASVEVALLDSGYDSSHRLLDHSLSLKTKGRDFINDRALQGDLGRHGTVVGSVIAAKHALGFKFSMAPEAKIVPLAVLKPSQEGSTDTTGDSNSVLAGLDYAIKNRVDLINASWGGDVCSRFIRDKIKEATDAGIPVVTAAGNEKSDLDVKPIFPGSFLFDLLITVGAVQPDLTNQKDSNFGSAVDFYALGEPVVVAAPQNSMEIAAGTSVSTPFITGALALLKGAFPNLNSLELLRALERSRQAQNVPNLELAYRDLEAQQNALKSLK